jgi:hypothetical protein
MSLILLVFAFVLTMIASLLNPIAAGPLPWRIPHLGWLGLSLYILVSVLGVAGVR